MISLSHQDFWKEPIRSVTCFCVTHRDSMVSTARTVARSIQHRFLGRPPGPATCLLLPTTQCLLHPAHPHPHIHNFTLTSNGLSGLAQLVLPSF